MNPTSVDWLLHMPLTTLSGIRLGLLCALLVAAAVIDYRTFRIPNWLTAGGMVIGLVLNTLEAWRPLNGLLWSLAALGVGLAVPLPLYALRIMGAGDVKLMAMVGAFLGLPQLLIAMLFVFVVGGIAALMFAIAHRSLLRLGTNMKHIVQGMALSVVSAQAVPGMAPGSSIGKLPYGVSISAGTLLYLVTRQLGYF